MDCKFCGAPLPDEELICPSCGADNAVQQVTDTPEEPVIADRMEEAADQVSDTPVCAQPADDVPESCQEQPKKKTSPWKIVLAVVVSVAVLAALAVGILIGMGVDLKPRENNAQYKSSYTVDGEAALKKNGDVIATMGDYKLTNGELQVHYWMQIYEFLEYYGTYYFDYTKGLDTQYYSEEDGITWQQYFIDIAIESWRRYTLLTHLAQQEGFQLDEEAQASLDAMAADLEEMAKEYEYASAEDMIREDMGAGCTLDDYIRYMELRNIGLVYFEEKYESFTPSEEEISAYFDENKATFEASGYKKEDQTLVDVRHILIQLADGEKDEYSRVNYTDDEWEQCRQQAQAVLDAYLEDPTEENFGELAKAHSVDGSASTGGLYTDVKAGQMVEEFNDWIFDPDRQSGDTDLVKTVYGYHVMYFVSSEVTEGDWYEAAKTQLVSDRANEMIESAGADMPLKVNYKKLVLAENALS